jgi:putative selenate reductase
MPAAAEEVQAMIDEGVKLVELTAPECMLLENGRVRSNVCFQMKLGEKDASGRPRPIKINGSEFELDVDSVISAIGQRVNADFFPERKLEINPATHETQIENVFAGGDAVRGASTLIKAIADGKKVANSICRRAVEDYKVPKSVFTKMPDPVELRKRKARRQPGTVLPEIGFSDRNGFEMVIQTLDEAATKTEAARCLQCDEICSVCVAVCPNRANMEFQMEPAAFKVQQAVKDSDGVEITDIETERIEQTYQVLNIGDYCNECGNCATFCPTSGAPYKDKAKFHLTPESFDAALFGYRFTAEDRLEFKNDQKHAVLQTTPDGYTFEDGHIKAVLNLDYSTQQVEFKNDAPKSVSLRPVVRMAILSNAVRGLVPLTLNTRD